MDNKEKMREYHKKYRETHKDKIREYQKKYWAEHGEEINAKRKNRKSYKVRCERAIEYITTEQLYTNYQWGKSQYAKILKDLLNILKGEDK